MIVTVSYHNETSDRFTGWYRFTLSSDLAGSIDLRANVSGKFWHGFLDVKLYNFADLVHLNFTKRQVDLMMSMNNGDMKNFKLNAVNKDRFLKEFWRLAMRSRPAA